MHDVVKDLAKDTRKAHLLFDGACGCDDCGDSGTERCKAWRDGIPSGSRWVEKGCTEAVQEGHLVANLTTDGFQPFPIDKLSLWPLIIKWWNMCPIHRERPENLEVVSLLPGTGEPKNINAFVHPMLEEIRLANAEGGFLVTLPDGVVRRVKVFIVTFTADYPARAKMLLQKGSGALAGCGLCHIKGVWDHDLHKTTYLMGGGERPPLRTHEEILSDGRAVEKLRATPRVTKKAVEDMEKDTGVKGVPAFASIEDFDLAADCPADAMHVFYGVGKKVRKLVVEALKGHDDANEAALVRASAVTPRQGMDLILSRLLSPLKEGRMVKSAEYLTAFRSGLFKYIIQDIPTSIMSSEVKLAIYGICDYIAICSGVGGNLAGSSGGAAQARERLQDMAWEALDNAERHLPAGFFTIITHLLVHLPDHVGKWGPLPELWQYGCERFLKSLKGYIKNRGHPHGSLFEGVAVYRV
jgi:hypothetical protein